jgi:hypothetical protein
MENHGAVTAVPLKQLLVKMAPLVFVSLEDFEMAKIGEAADPGILPQIHSMAGEEHLGDTGSQGGMK